jgi:hypothetical protein
MLDFLNGVPGLGAVKQALDPATGYQTAAAGAKAAQAQSNQLSDLQWQRQMQGLQQSQGYNNQLQSLYNSLYTPGHGQAAPGGMSTLPSANPGMGMTMASMQPPSATPPPGAPKPSTQPGSGGWRGGTNSGGGTMNQAFQWLP